MLTELFATHLDDWSEQGSHAWRIMESYERWFGDGPEVAVLRLLGLFDRMANEGETAALRAVPVIPELTDALIDLSEQQWVHALRRLRQAGLLLPPDPKTPHAVDAHPLVREYYRHKLRAHHPAAWRAGHERLYTYFQEVILEEDPTSLEALSPLYAAVTHGCLAGRVQEALCLFRQRIRRNADHFSSEQHRAFGTDLAALSGFFEVTWSKIVSGLQADDSLFLFFEVGQCLSALGRVSEAEEPLQKALELARRQKNWTRAAITATRLSEVYRARGDLTTALRFVEKSVIYASRPGVPTQVALLSHAFLGFAQYWVGQFQKAKATFQRAEELQACATPERAMLHSVPGYQYHELFLDDLDSQACHMAPRQLMQAWDGLRKRIEQALSWAEEDAHPRDIGLQHVSMGRVYILALEHHIAEDLAGSLTTRAAQRLETIPSPTVDVYSVTTQAEALRHLTYAVEYLDASDHRNYLPRALLTRAALYRLQGNVTWAHADVNAALQIAENGAMDFYQADGYLEKTALYLVSYRLSLDADDFRHASVSLNKAKTLIHSMGYFRRSRQVMALEAMLQRDASH